MRSPRRCSSCVSRRVPTGPPPANASGLLRDPVRNRIISYIGQRGLGFPAFYCSTVCKERNRNCALLEKETDLEVKEV